MLSGASPLRWIVVADIPLIASQGRSTSYFTFGFGFDSKTISAELVQRLARFHATIWIDTSGSGRTVVDTRATCRPQAVPLPGGRIGRNVLLGVLSRGHEIASVGRPTYGRLSFRF